MDKPSQENTKKNHKISGDDFELNSDELHERGEFDTLSELGSETDTYNLLNDLGIPDQNTTDDNDSIDDILNDILAKDSDLSSPSTGTSNNDDGRSIDDIVNDILAEDESSDQLFQQDNSLNDENQDIDDMLNHLNSTAEAENELAEDLTDHDIDITAITTDNTYDDSLENITSNEITTSAINISDELDLIDDKPSDDNETQIISEYVDNLDKDVKHTKREAVFNQTTVLNINKNTPSPTPPQPDQEHNKKNNTKLRLIYLIATLTVTITVVMLIVNTSNEAVITKQNHDKTSNHTIERPLPNWDKPLAKATKPIKKPEKYSANINTKKASTAVTEVNIDIKLPADNNSFNNESIKPKIETHENDVIEINTVANTDTNRKPHKIKNNNNQSEIKTETYQWALNLMSLPVAGNKSRNELDRITKSGIDANILPVTINNQPWNRIRITGFKNRESAINYMGVVTQKTGIKTFWVNKISIKSM